MISRLFLIVLLTTILTACASQTPTATVLPPRLSEIQTAKQLIIGTAITRPFEYRDPQTNALIGFDVDLMTALVAPLGVEIVWREMAFADLLPELQAGNITAVIAGMYITPTREEQVDMSIPYLQTGLVLVSRTDLMDIATTADLAGRTVAVKEGSTGERYANRLRDEQGIALEVRRYADTLDSLDDLANGLADAAFNDYINTLEYIKTHPNVRVVGDILEPAGLGISVQTGDTALLEFINARLQTLEADGTVERLFNQWMRTDEAS